MAVETTNANLSVPSSGRSLVYQAIVAKFRADPTLKRVVNSWHAYLGDDATDGADFSEAELPAVRIMPAPLGASPETNTRQNSPLGFQLTIATDGLDVRDVLDLWACFEAVVFTGDGGRSIITSLQAAWPKTVSVRLSQPAINAQYDEQRAAMFATGMIVVEMQVAR